MIRSVKFTKWAGAVKMDSERTAEVFLSLLEPISDSLYRHAKRTVWRADLAADVVQEAIMTSWRKFDQFELGTNFRAWMFRILINSIFRVNKKTNRRQEVALDAIPSVLDEVFARENEWASMLEDPDRLIQSLDERLVEALDELSSNERRCLLLRLIEGFSYKEIASLLVMPLGTVMSHVHRARMKLRERLAAMAVEQGLLREVV